MFAHPIHTLGITYGKRGMEPAIGSLVIINSSNRFIM